MSQKSLASILNGQVSENGFLCLIGRNLYGACPTRHGVSLRDPNSLWLLTPRSVRV